MTPRRTAGHRRSEGHGGEGRGLPERPRRVHSHGPDQPEGRHLQLGTRPAAKAAAEAVRRLDAVGARIGLHCRSSGTWHADPAGAGGVTDTRERLRRAVGQYVHDPACFDVDGHSAVKAAPIWKRISPVRSADESGRRRPANLCRPGPASAGGGAVAALFRVLVSDRSDSGPNLDDRLLTGRLRQYRSGRPRLAHPAGSGSAPCSDHRPGSEAKECSAQRRLAEPGVVGALLAHRLGWP